MTRKACRRCKLLIKGSECPVCKNANLTDSWQGRINVLDHEKSEIAKKINITAKGEYAIKVR